MVIIQKFSQHVMQSEVAPFTFSITLRVERCCMKLLDIQALAQMSQNCVCEFGPPVGGETPWYRTFGDDFFEEGCSDSICRLPSEWNKPYIPGSAVDHGEDILEPPLTTKGFTFRQGSDQVGMND